MGPVEQQQTIRGWFAEHGWQLQPTDLRHALQEQGADDDLIVELIDEGADRRRAADQARPRTPPTVPATAATPSTNGGQTVPQNLEAEEHVLGAIILSPTALSVCRRILSPEGGEFYRESHGVIWRAALAVDDRDPGGLDAITLIDELDRRGLLDKAGGRVRIHELQALVPSTANAGHYARIVADVAIARGVIRLGGETARAGYERAGTGTDLLDTVRDLLEQLERQAATGRERITITPAGGFLNAATDTVPVLLGTPDDKLLPAHGFALLYGKGAAGKTTLTLTAVAALASATPWLGVPVPHAARILLIENEGPKAPFVEKVNRFANQWDGPDFTSNVAFYDEPWGRFNLADRGMRDDLLHYTRDQRIDLIVAGPLRGLGMQGPGAPAETDAFLTLLKDAGLGTEVAWWIVHHTNKAQQISGDWDRQPDLLIRLTYEGKRRQRLQWEKIRWGDQGREPLTLQWLDTGVGYTILDTTPEDVDWQAVDERVLAAVTANPGASQRRIEELAGGKAAHIRQSLTRLQNDHQIENRGTGNRKHFHPADTEPAPTLLDAEYTGENEPGW